MGIKYQWLKSLVRERKLTPLERMSSRVGYMGAGLLMAGQWTFRTNIVHYRFYMCNYTS